MKTKINTFLISIVVIAFLSLLCVSFFAGAWLEMALHRPAFSREFSPESYIVMVAPYLTEDNFLSEQRLPKGVIKQLINLSNSNDAYHLVEITNNGKFIAVTTVHPDISKSASLPRVVVMDIGSKDTILAH